MVSLHRKCLSATGLAIDKDSRMEASHNLLYKVVGASTPEHAFLRRTFIEDLVKRVGLYTILLVSDPVQKYYHRC